MIGAVAHDIKTSISCILSKLFTAKLSAIQSSIMIGVLGHDIKSFKNCDHKIIVFSAFHEFHQYEFVQISMLHL